MWPRGLSMYGVSSNARRTTTATATTITRPGANENMISTLVGYVPTGLDFK